MSVIRAFITYASFPLVFASAMVAALAGLAAGWDPRLLLAGITVTSVTIVAICERLNPEFENWNTSQGDVGTDATHALISMVLIPRGIEVGLNMALLGVAIKLSSYAGSPLWPTHWHPLAQLVPALVVSQLPEYWAHRLMHERPLLWRLHATHHSPGRLYWLNAARFHPLDTAIANITAVTPLALLGVSAEVLLLMTVWIAVHGMYQHCNVHLRLGPLNYIFSMAELHRWHHSLVLEEANANYGNNIIFWDLVFGTFFWPRDRDATADIGIANLPAFPKGYLGQILSPFRWSHITGQG